jgi:uncharacterized protein (DUF427 family)
MERIVKTPGPDHPITIERHPGRILVEYEGRIVSDTRFALILREANYPPVHYIPRDDADIQQLIRSDHATYCPYKGECSYYDLPGGGTRTKNAVWTYESPYEAIQQIKDYLALYSDRVKISEVPS